MVKLLLMEIIILHHLFAKRICLCKSNQSDTVIIMDTRYQTIVEHSRLYGKGKESMNWLPYIDLMSKRPTAIKYTGFYENLPDNWKKYLSDLPAEEKREALLALHTMLLKHDINVASDVLSITLSNGVKDADSILASYRRLTSPVHQMNPIQLKPTVIKMPVFQTDKLSMITSFQRSYAKMKGKLKLL